MNIDVRYKDFGLYNVDLSYLKYLHGVDGEVRYSEEKAYGRKPFLGIVLMIGAYAYFIPLTSPKPKHAGWRNTGRTHYLVYETIDEEERRPGDVVKPQDRKLLKVLAALDIKKMIPVPEGLYRRIDFAQAGDRRYQALLQKEYRFCQRIQDRILERAGEIYGEQKAAGKVYPMYCNFSALELACDRYDKGADSDGENGKVPGWGF